MAFLAPKTDLSPGQSNRQSYDVSGPVPVVMGRARIPMRLLERPWNYTNDINHGQRRPAGHAASLAYMGCHGPIDALFKLYINGHPVFPHPIWRPHNGAPSVNQGVGWYETFQGGRNIGKIFRYRVHWGTVEQEQDPFLNGGLFLPGSAKAPLRNEDGTPRNHPPYSGLFYIVFEQLHFDDPYKGPGDAGLNGSSSVPNIEAEVFVQPPYAYADHEYGVNPVAATREILRNPVWGADLPESIVPESAWAAAAAEMHEQGYFFLKNGQGNLSPVLGEQRPLAAHFADFFSIYDGFLKLRAGQLLPGWFPNMPGDEPAGITTLTRDHCTDEPDIDPEGWEDTASAVAVTTRNLFERMEEETIVERSAYNRRITGRDVERSISAPAIIHPYPRAMFAARELHRAAYPGFAARLSVLPRQARNPDGSLLLPGDLARLNYAPYALDMLCRVIEREDRPGRVVLHLARERGRFPEDFVPAPEMRSLPQQTPAEPLQWLRALEAPPALVPDARPGAIRRAFAVLAQRPSADTVGALLYYSLTGDFAGEEESLRPLIAWASVALADAEITAEAAAIRFNPTAAFALALNRDYSSAEQANGHILAIAGHEILSLGQRLGGDDPDGTRHYAVTRGMFGTPPALHAPGSPIHFIPGETFPEILRAHRTLDQSDSLTAYIAATAYTSFEAAEPNAPVTLVTEPRLPAELPRPPFTLFVWARSATQPPAPEGGTYESPEPTSGGWSLTHPVGTDPLWFSQRTYMGDSAPGVWSTPVRGEGKDGQDGVSGQDGQDGKDGEDGKDGADGKDGVDGTPGQDGASTLMAFGRFLNQPPTPTQTVAPPSASWSLDSETAPGAAIYPLWVSVGTRAVGSALWVWQKPFRFTPLDGEDGSPGENGLSVAHLTIYRRAESAPSTPTGGTYNFDTKALVGLPGGWSQTIPLGDAPLWASTAMAAVPGPSGVSGTLSWSTPRQIARNGDPALSTVQLFVYKRSTSSNLTETPSGGSYNFGTKTFTTPTSPSGWSATIPDDAALGFVYISTALAAAIGNNGIDSSLTWTQSRRLTDDMILADGSVDEDKLAPNAVTTGKIAADAVVAVHIKSDEIETRHIKAFSIEGDKIAANAITAGKINVDTLAAIQTNTGNLVVDGEVRSGVYTSGASGWKIKSDGGAEFNELTLRKGIVSADDILLHDPTNLVYNPEFRHFEAANVPPPGWNFRKSSDTAWPLPQHWPDIVPGSGIGPGIRISDPRDNPTSTPLAGWTEIRNNLFFPVFPGERIYCGGYVHHSRNFRFGLDWRDANKNWLTTHFSPYCPFSQSWRFFEHVFNVPSDIDGVPVRYCRFTLRRQDPAGPPQHSDLNLAGVRVNRLVGHVASDIPTVNLAVGSQHFGGASITIPRPGIPDGLTLRFTVDGSEVTLTSQEWTSTIGSLVFNATTTLRVRYFSSSTLAGPESVYSYTKSDEATAPPYASPTVVFTRNENTGTVSITQIDRGSNPSGQTRLHWRVNHGVLDSENTDNKSLTQLISPGEYFQAFASDLDGSRMSAASTVMAYLSSGGSGWIT